MNEILSLHIKMNNHIIHSIINERRWGNPDYKRFLIDNEQLLIGLLQTEYKIKASEENRRVVQTEHTRVFIQVVEEIVEKLDNVIEILKTMIGETV